MIDEQKEALKNHVLDLRGLGASFSLLLTPQPMAAPTNVTFTCSTCTGTSKIIINDDRISIMQERSDGKMIPLEQSLPPGSYHYTYWQNGVHQMQLPFSVKTGEANVVKVK